MEIVSRSLLKRLALLASVVLIQTTRAQDQPEASSNMSVTAVQRVPYYDGLTQGQGYNTYLQEGCMHEAVIVTSHRGENGDLQTDYDSELITSFDKLTQILEVSAAAAIKAPLGGGGGIEASFLDKSEFESSTITYVVWVDVSRQTDSTNTFEFEWNHARNPHERYGDRFISDFKKGAALYARVSITTQDSSKDEEVKAAANVAFTMFAAHTDISTSVRDAVNRINQHSTVSIKMHYVGVPPAMQSDFNAQEDNSDLLAVKKKADDFLVAASDPNNANWIRYAILEKYENIDNFDQEFDPLDYTDASLRTWPVYIDASDYKTELDYVRTLDPSVIRGGNDAKTALYHAAADAMEVYHEWIRDVVKDPQVARTMPDVESPQSFHQRILDSHDTCALNRRDYSPVPNDIVKSSCTGAWHGCWVQATETDNLKVGEHNYRILNAPTQDIGPPGERSNSYADALQRCGGLCAGLSGCHTFNIATTSEGGVNDCKPTWICRFADNGKDFDMGDYQNSGIRFSAAYRWKASP